MSHEEDGGGEDGGEQQPQHGRPRSRGVDEETLSYLKEIQEHFGTLTDDEERQLLASRVIEELQGAIRAALELLPAARRIKLPAARRRPLRAAAAEQPTALLAGGMLARRRGNRTRAPAGKEVKAATDTAASRILEKILPCAGPKELASFLAPLCSRDPLFEMASSPFGCHVAEKGEQPPASPPPPG
jgi:hypothetical protein